jgi:L-lactate dehydrogenase complex protein LldG
MENHQPTVLEKVRKALGRSAPLPNPPTPPSIDPQIARLVHTETGLPDLFARQAQAMKMKLSTATAADITTQLIQFIQESNLKKIAVADSPLFDRLGILPALKQANIDAVSWSDLTLDQIYDDFDCALTDVTYAVAETGSLVIEPTASNGRALSLVTFVHIAIVEPKNILPDLVDLMEKLADPARSRSNIILITGPSKTADIEMNVVTGVHGPNIVKVFLLS